MNNFIGTMNAGTTRRYNEIPFCGAAFWLPAILLLLLAGCAPGKRVARFAERQLSEGRISEQFTGLLMVDADSRDTLFALNSGRYFTPASNVKLLTFYAALKNLPARMPALKYVRRGDTLCIVGTGDPAALHPDLADSTALRFMRSFPRVSLVNTNLEDAPWGPGWAWDDFDQYYTPSRSAFPIGGNVLRMVGRPAGPLLSPDAFADSIGPGPSGFARHPEHNRFYRIPPPGDTLDIPIRMTPETERELWSRAAGRELAPAFLRPGEVLQTLPGIATDSLFKKMMTESDNFIAEQLMLAVSATLGDTLSFRKAREHVLEEQLKGMPQPPRWVDGSGLSRYNLITPESLVFLLARLYEEFPRERLFALLARGGEHGTLRNLYRDPEGPYLFGKTGSLSNNHNLSGYLLTRSGRTVIFSFMNNHYTVPTAVVQGRMERLLGWVRENY